MPDHENAPIFISASALAARIGSEAMRLFDASYSLPGSGVDVHANFLAAHLPGAMFFDIDQIADRENPLPHMMPDAGDFAKAMAGMGLEPDDTVVIYDQTGISMAAARAWWMLRAIGHRQIMILSGGLPAWIAAGLPLETGAADSRPASDYAVTAARPVFITADELTAARDAMLIDARSAGRFNGTAPEPRAGIRSGHIPGARNLPFTELIDPESRTLLPETVLRERLAPFLPDKPVICYCGSGITACIPALALAVLGHSNVRIYDGSWTEWGADDSGYPVES